MYVSFYLDKNKQFNIARRAFSSVIEHGMTLSFQTAVQKNEAKLNCFVQFENEMKSYHAL